MPPLLTLAQTKSKAMTTYSRKQKTGLKHRFLYVKKTRKNHFTKRLELFIIVLLTKKNKVIQGGEGNVI